MLDPGRRAVLTTGASGLAVAAAARRGWQAAPGGSREPQADGGEAELPCARAGAAGGGACAAGLEALPRGKRGAAARGVHVGLGAGEGQAGNGVAEDEDDGCRLARRDGRLPL